ncbi:MAG: amidohydrolase family protein [Nocardioidaceae bacterium]
MPSNAVIVDDHAHPFPLETTRLPWDALGLLLAPPAASPDAPEPLFVEALRVRLAGLLGCPTEDVVQAREDTAKDWQGYVRILADDVGLATTLMDGGSSVLTPAQLQQYANLYDRPVHGIVRIEAVADPLIGQGASSDEVADAVSAALAQGKASGVVAAKTVLAYRTGLCVDPDADPKDVDRAKGLRDWLMRRLLGWCSDLAMPLQIHSGFGDSDLRLATANPVGLEPLLRTPEGRSATVVLIHGSFPWHEQAAYLAAVHPNVYLEVSLHPVFSPSTTVERLHRMLDLAPVSKLLTGSDGHVTPELQWFSLRNTLDAWGTLAERLAHWVRPSWMERTRHAVLAGTAQRVYGLGV